MPPLYVSFATPAYASEAAGLIESLNAFRLPRDVRPLPSVGTWELNCSRKPAFIREMRAEHPGRSLVWLDADARVMRRPDLFDSLAADFAAHWFRESELISACLYFAPTEPAGELLRRWEAECRRQPAVWDQKSLQSVIERDAPAGMTAYALPPEYNWIDAGGPGPDLSEQAYGKREAVIVQRQASRRLRKAVQ